MVGAQGLEPAPAKELKCGTVFAPEELSQGSCGHDDLREDRNSTLSASYSLDSVGSVLRKIKPELVISKQKLRQADGSFRVRLKRDKGQQNVGFSSRRFVLCGLPVRKPRPGDMPYERRKGLHLSTRRNSLTVTEMA